MVQRSENKERRFSVRELRALLWLLPVLTVASWLVWEISRPKTTTDEPVSVLEEDAAISRQRGAYARLATEPNEEHTETYVTNSATSVTQHPPTDHEKFTFDPNTVKYHDLLRLGFTRGEALGIIKYRERGKVFEIPEDFAACYQVSEEMYRRLEPYIRIGEEFRLKPFERTSSLPETRFSRRSGVDVAESSPSAFVGGVADGAPTEGGQDGIVQGVQPVSNNEEVRRMQPDHESHSVLIDLNTADSTSLISVSGIGERTVVSIMEYRARLGGFVAVEQLAEVRGVTEQNYERMIEQIYVDPAVIQKIDINFAPAKTLAAHPYIRAEALRKLLKQRQLKGGWCSLGELEADNIFTAEELAKLGPYLLFN